MASNNFLDKSGLGYLWGKITNKITTSEANITAKIPKKTSQLENDSNFAKKTDLKGLAFKDKVDKTDLSDAVQASLDKAAVLYTSQTLSDGQKSQARGNINAAPGGYGLGEPPKYIADANDAVKNGWYAIDVNTLNLPNATENEWNYTYLRVDVGYRPDVYIKQTVTSSYRGFRQCEITRCKLLGVWQPWEWVNPPMQLGVEYRTTERYLGKPVYVKLVNCGAMPNSAQKTVSAGISNGESLVDICGEYYNSSTSVFLPYVNNGEDIVKCSAYIRDGSCTIKLWAKGDESSQNARVLIKYTKTTD